MLRNINSVMPASSLRDILKPVQGKEAAVQSMPNEPQAAIPLTVQGSSSEFSIMSGNFASANKGQSSYVAATLNSFTVNKQMQNQATNRVTALLDTLGGIQGPSLYGGPGSKGSVSEATIKLAIKRIKDAEAQEASEKNLEDIKKDIDKRTQEALAPKDENGKPIEGLPTSPESDATPAPEYTPPPPQADSAAPELNLDAPLVGESTSQQEPPQISINAQNIHLVV